MTRKTVVRRRGDILFVQVVTIEVRRHLTERVTSELRPVEGEEVSYLATRGKAFQAEALRPECGISQLLLHNELPQNLVSLKAVIIAHNSKGQLGRAGLARVSCESWVRTSGDVWVMSAHRQDLLKCLKVGCLSAGSADSSLSSSTFSLSAS